MFCYLIIRILRSNRKDMQTQSRNQNRRQTAFRLDKELLFYLNRKAKSQGKTLNALVEETLRREVKEDMDGWPIIKEPIIISDEVKSMSLGIKFTPEEIAADERLAYLLSK